MTKMTSKIVFRNEGEIDVRAITTMGVSVKDEGAIGYFGTGLKFAIATILRNGGKVTIHSGEEKYIFGVNEEVIRDKPFNVVTMNDQSLGFTTNLGRDWQPWMAVREILCNCEDEMGSHGEGLLEDASEGFTVIIVECSEFAKAYADKDSFILNRKGKMVFSNDAFEIWEGSSHSLFYKGVKVYSAKRPFLYTYNILNKVGLSEDRQAKHQEYLLNCQLSELICGVNNQEYINKLVNSGNDYIEYSLGFNWCTPCDELKQAVMRKSGVVDDKVPPALSRLCKPTLSEQLKSKPDLELDMVQELQLKKAIDFLKKLKVFTDEYPIRVMDTLGERTLGLADRDTNTIYLSQSVFDMGSKYVAGTLYEEYIHLKHGVDDETRAFQDVVINHLMSVGERLHGEPL